MRRRRLRRALRAHRPAPPLALRSLRKPRPRRTQLRPPTRGAWIAGAADFPVRLPLAICAGAGNRRSETAYAQWACSILIGLMDHHREVRVKRCRGCPPAIPPDHLTLPLALLRSLA